MKVVVNTTPIISLASIGQLELLQRLFGTIMIAEAVYQEIRTKQSYGYDQIESEWIEVQAIQGQLYKQLLLSRNHSVPSPPAKGERVRVRG